MCVRVRVHVRMCVLVCVCVCVHVYSTGSSYILLGRVIPSVYLY